MWYIFYQNVFSFSASQVSPCTSVLLVITISTDRLTWLLMNLSFTCLMTHHLVPGRPGKTSSSVSFSFVEPRNVCITGMCWSLISSSLGAANWAYGNKIKIVCRSDTRNRFRFYIVFIRHIICEKAALAHCKWLYFLDSMSSLYNKWSGKCYFLFFKVTK